MFWDLKGATDTPSCSKIRHRAAVRIDFPALEQVPWNIKDGVDVAVVLLKSWLRLCFIVSKNEYVSGGLGKGECPFYFFREGEGAVRRVMLPLADLLTCFRAFHANNRASRHAVPVNEGEKVGN